MNQEIIFNNFKNIGFIQSTFTTEQLKPVREEITKIQNDFDNFKSQKANFTLAGNISKEFFLEDSADHLENLILPLVGVYDQLFDYTKSFNIMEKSYPLMLEVPWVNFQSKGEFNPNHDHSGILSFVLYIQVPYLIQDEMKTGSGAYSNRNVPGHFEFTYANALGNIQTQSIPVDKTYENTILVFPSKMQHCVYPFFTSDDYRISISGNFKLKI